MFFKLYFHFNAFSAENLRLFSIEFQFHTNTHITLWLTVVPRGGLPYESDGDARRLA